MRPHREGSGVPLTQETSGSSGWRPTTDTSEFGTCQVSGCFDENMFDVPISQCKDFVLADTSKTMFRKFLILAEALQGRRASDPSLTLLASRGPRLCTRTLARSTRTHTKVVSASEGVVYRGIVLIFP